MRLFIAIPLPHPLQQDLDLWWHRESLLFPDWRGMPARSRHLTLHFLGEVDEKQLDGLSEILSQLAAETPPLQLAVHGTGFFPSVARAQTFWVGVEEETGNLQHCARSCRHLCQSVQGRGGKAPRFRAHITMARHSGRVNGVRLLEQISMPPAFSWEAGEIQLIKSQLHPQGARYQLVERFALGQAY